MGIKAFIYSLVFLTSVVSAKPIINCESQIWKSGAIYKKCDISSDIGNKYDVVFAFQNKRAEFQNIIYEQWKDVYFEEIVAEDAKDEETGESLFLSYGFRMFSPSFYNGKMGFGLYNFHCQNITDMKCAIDMFYFPSIH